MMREQLDVSGFGGREFLQPIGMDDHIRSGKRRVRNFIANCFLIALIFGKIIGIVVISGPMYPRKQIGFIADLERQKAVTRARRHRQGFIHCLFHAAAPQIKSPNQPPTRGAQKRSEIHQPAPVDHGSLGG